MVETGNIVSFHAAFVSLSWKNKRTFSLAKTICKVSNLQCSKKLISKKLAAIMNKLIQPSGQKYVTRIICCLKQQSSTYSATDDHDHLLLLSSLNPHKTKYTCNYQFAKLAATDTSSDTRDYTALFLDEPSHGNLQSRDQHFISTRVILIRHKVKFQQIKKKSQMRKHLNKKTQI